MDLFSMGPVYSGVNSFFRINLQQQLFCENFASTPHEDLDTDMPI